MSSEHYKGKESEKNERKRGIEKEKEKRTDREIVRKRDSVRKRVENTEKG